MPSGEAKRRVRTTLRVSSRRNTRDLYSTTASTGDWVFDMYTTCEYRNRMSKMIQIRNVPDDLHRQLKARAALEGLSLSDYLLLEVRRVAERPTVSELRRRLPERGRVRPHLASDLAVRAERDRR